MEAAGQVAGGGEAVRRRQRHEDQVEMVENVEGRRGKQESGKGRECWHPEQPATKNGRDSDWFFGLRMLEGRFLYDWDECGKCCLRITWLLGGVSGMRR